MKIQQQIENRLKADFSPHYLDVINESSNHNVPEGAESHFKVVLVSQRFNDMALLGRHRLVNETLAEELAGPVHALTMHLFTKEEWDDKKQQSFISPPCMGGSKAEQQ